MNKINFAQVWCQLNRFEYPKEFGDEPTWWNIDKDRTQDFSVDMMGAIRVAVSAKEISRAWNSGWDDAEFESNWSDLDFRSAWGDKIIG